MKTKEAVFKEMEKARVEKEKLDRELKKATDLFNKKAQANKKLADELASDRERVAEKEKSLQAAEAEIEASQVDNALRVELEMKKEEHTEWLAQK